MIEGTLIGTAFLISTSFWIGASLFFYALTYFLDIKLDLVEILSRVGYSLFSYCIILLSFVFHFPHFTSFFGKHLFMFLFGGLSSFNLSRFFCSRTSKRFFFFFLQFILIFFFFIFF